MPIESLKHHRLVAAAAASVACLALISGCSSSAKSTGATGSAGSAGSTGAAGSTNQPAAGSPISAAAGGGSGSVTATCPTSAVVAASLKYTFAAPKQSSDAGTVLCNYSDSADDDLVIIFAPLPGGTAAALKIAMDSQAQAQNVADSPVPGLGQAAYLFTMADASSNPDGVNTTTLAVLSGGKDMTITATAPPAEVEALARSIIGG